MMELYPIILIAILAYFIGSIPSAVWIGKWFFGVDVREHGSGNAGSTNTFRVLGVKAGIPVQIIDIMKGFLAASLAIIFHNNLGLFRTDMISLLALFFGISAVIGHVFPLFANFKGGKGINTLLGMMIAIQPYATLACVIVFIVIVLTTKYVSLGSIIGTLTFPVSIILSTLFFANEKNAPLVIFGFSIFLLVVLTHQKNIKRLLKGEENKANIRLKKKKVT